MSKKSLFITFEGGEGAGKSTLISHLDVELRNSGWQTMLTREPGGSALGEHIRLLLLNHDPKTHIAPYAELFLFLAARAQHIEEVIKPALAEGKVVLCDRFNDSTIAYQGYARALGVEAVEELCRVACGGVTPDLTFYLNLDPGKGMERASKQGRVMDRMEGEKMAFHEKVRQGFLDIAAKDRDRVVVIDANQTQEQVFKQAFGIIDQKYRE